MVDSVNSSSSHSLLRAQQAAQVQQARTPHATINQSKAAAVVPVQAHSVPQPLKVASASSNLPRGSIVDKLI